MNVIFLCAGYGTRLYPLTENTPKALLTVGEGPILSYLVEEISASEDDVNFYVVTNDKFAEQFTEWKEKNHSDKSIAIVNDMTTSEDDKLGAIGDLGFIINEKAITGETLVVAGDNIFDFNLKEFLSFSRSVDTEVVVGAYDVNDRELAKKYGILDIESDGRISSFLEKPEDPPSTFASLGLYLFSARGIELVQKYLDEGLNKDQPGHYIRWLVENYNAHAHVFSGAWFDIGDIKSYEAANNYFNRRKT